MDHSQIIETCIENIEAHLKEELTVQSLSQKAGFSPYYFCRVFEVYTGLPVMEYVRRRRLAHAETELWEGRRITDIAADYGFDTHSGFSKAFKKIYVIHRVSTAKEQACTGRLCRIRFHA